MSKAKTDTEGNEITIVSRNRRATHDYEISERLEAGMVLVGSEVKSLRAGHANLDGSYAQIVDGEVWLYEAEIPEYEMSNRLNHKPKRARKLLLHRREIGRFAGKASERGCTIVPLAVYFKNGRAKVELGVARGKKAHDKRETLKKADARREIDRTLAARRKH